MIGGEKSRNFKLLGDLGIMTTTILKINNFLDKSHHNRQNNGKRLQSKGPIKNIQKAAGLKPMLTEMHVQESV